MHVVSYNMDYGNGVAAIVTCNLTCQFSDAGESATFVKWLQNWNSNSNHTFHPPKSLKDMEKIEENSEILATSLKKAEKELEELREFRNNKLAGTIQSLEI